MQKVQILLSTFNGQKHLLSQLESLRLQSHTNISVLARDDGSRDESPKILEEYRKVWPAFELLQTPPGNLGVIDSFFELLRQSDPSAQFYAFSDQDDVWLNQKLERACSFLNDIDPEIPAIYFSRLKLVDENLNRLGLSAVPKVVTISNALVENVATGCTMLINRALRNLVLSDGIPQKSCLMHDWWLYLVALTSGKVFYDKEPSILYRQHEDNVVGAQGGKISRLVKVRFSARHLTQQVREFYRLYAERLNGKDRKFIEEFLASKSLGFVGRLRYALSTSLRRQSCLQTLFLRVLILFNRY